MTREGYSRSHESPSYKVNNHPHMRRHIYIYTYIMYNAITQSRKVNKHCQRSKGMAQQGTGNVKQTLPYPGNVAQVRSRKSKRVQGEEES